MKEEVILKLLNEQYPLHFDSLTFLRDSGCVTYAVHADTDDKRYFLRITKPAFLDTVAKSLEVHLFLQQQNFAVPPLRMTRDGLPYGKAEEITEEAGAYSMLLLYEFIEGGEPDLTQDAEALGAFIGKLHQVMKGYPGSLVKRDRRYYVERYLEIMQQKGYAHVDSFRKYGEKLWNRVKDLPYGYCHGDLYPGNLLKSKDGVFYVLDFDTSCQGFPMYDVALLCNSTDFFELEADGYAKTKAVYERFLPNYLQYSKRSKAEQAAFFDLIALYHFALQATIIEVFGMDCVDNAFFDRQLSWLQGWERQKRENGL